MSILKVEYYQKRDFGRKKKLKSLHSLDTSLFSLDISIRIGRVCVFLYVALPIHQFQVRFQKGSFS